MSKLYLIFGSTGLIGSSLTEQVNNMSGSRVLAVPRSMAESGSPSEGLARLIAGARLPICVFYCMGPTDPLVSREEHLKYHVELPRVWMKWLLAHSELDCFTTFGSVHESSEKLTGANAYFWAKKAWHESVRRDQNRVNLHLQLHTVYGNILKPQSFLGQMYSAISQKKTFKMSTGVQLREYHPAACIAEVVVRLVSANQRNPEYALSHGHPIRLRNLAAGIFESFGMGSQLEFGGALTAEGEISECNWEPTPAPYTPRYVEPIRDIVSLFQEKISTGRPPMLPQDRNRE